MFIVSVFFWEESYPVSKEKPYLGNVTETQIKSNCFV